MAGFGQMSGHRAKTILKMQEIVRAAVIDGRWHNLTREESMKRAGRLIGISERRVRTILSMPLDGHLEACELAAALEWQRKHAEAELRKNKEIVSRSDWGGFG